MKIDMVAWGDTIPGLSFKPGDEKGAITAEAFRYSKPVNYKGARLMEIHQTSQAKQEYVMSDEDKLHESKPLAPTPQKEGDKAEDSPALKQLRALRKEKPTLVALVPLPAMSRCTVLLAPIGEGFFQGYVIEDDPSKLPVGRVRIMNLSPHLIAMRCNGTTGKELKTRESFSVPAVGGGIIYELAYQHENEWIKQENNMIAVEPNEQVQLIVLKSDNQFFLSADGSRSGFLQLVRLKRKP